MVAHGRDAVEAVKTVLEVADVAWNAIEHHRHHTDSAESIASLDDELLALRSENRRLRSLLEENIKLLQNLTPSLSLSRDCPPDLYAHLAATVDSKTFLTQLKSLHQKSIDGNGMAFPFKEASGTDSNPSEILINVDLEEPSWWVWVTDEMVPSIVEERSGIDNENYVIISEEHVVDGVATFLARCIVSNPKAQNLTPEELQKAVGKAVKSMNKLEKILSIWHAGQMFYALSTWGLALTGLYQSRGILKLAAKGVHATSKVVLRAL